MAHQIWEPAIAVDCHMTTGHLPEFGRAWTVIVVRRVYRKGGAMKPVGPESGLLGEWSSPAVHVYGRGVRHTERAPAFLLLGKALRRRSRQ
jgi:hypothetical protein